MGDGGEESGRHSLAGHIAQDDRQRASGVGDEIVEVAADLTGRLRAGRHIQAGDGGENAGQQARLNLGGDFQLAAQPLLGQELRLEAGAFDDAASLVGQGDHELLVARGKISGLVQQAQDGYHLAGFAVVHGGRRYQTAFHARGRDRQSRFQFGRGVADERLPPLADGLEQRGDQRLAPPLNPPQLWGGGKWMLAGDTVELAVALPSHKATLCPGQSHGLIYERPQDVVQFQI